MPIFLYMIFQFFLGVIQIIQALYRYFFENSSYSYKTKLERYGLYVMSYFSVWIIATHLPVDWMQGHIGVPIMVIFFILIPLCLAFYFKAITLEEEKRRSEPEELEKLIF